MVENKARRSQGNRISLGSKHKKKGDQLQPSTALRKKVSKPRLGTFLSAIKKEDDRKRTIIHTTKGASAAYRNEYYALQRARAALLMQAASSSIFIPSSSSSMACFDRSTSSPASSSSSISSMSSAATEVLDLDLMMTCGAFQETGKCDHEHCMCTAWTSEEMEEWSDPLLAMTSLIMDYHRRPDNEKRTAAEQEEEEEEE